MKLKRDKFDKVVSDLVRERTDFICENCGLDCRHQPGYLDCSHYNSRAAYSTRYCLDNCFAHCKSCHKYLGDRPGAFTKHFIEKRGAYLEQVVTERSWKPKKWPKCEKEDMYQHYKSELKRILELRKNGAVGYLEVVGWI